MRFGKISLRPPGGMIRVRMVKADNIFSAATAFALNAHELPRVDVIAIVGGIRARVAAAGCRGDEACSIFLEAAEQNATALVRICLFAVSA